MGDGVEIMGVAEIRQRWGIQRTEQVVDVLALMGDSSDNVPGVPGIGEKTAIKLIAKFGSVENLLAHTADLKGRVKESLETHRDQALLSKQLGHDPLRRALPVRTGIARNSARRTRSRLKSAAGRIRIQLHRTAAVRR